MEENNQSFHHYLITGEIVFIDTANPEGIHAVRINGILLTDTKDLPARSLGKAQQILQLNFHQKMQDEKVQVVDVVLANFTYLGYMTQEQFHQAPEGTKLQVQTVSVKDLDKAVAEANGKPN